MFRGKLIYPRQLEIHLPSDHKKPCNFHCFYCAGKKFQKDLGTFEVEGLELLWRLQGRIPYIIYGGSYTEPLLNPYFMTYLSVTKATGSHFGIHTNGSILYRLEENTGWLTELCRIAEDKIDYISISLDAGFSYSHCKTKGIVHDWFNEIIRGIEEIINIRGNNPGPAIRICYLMNEFNSSEEEIHNIVVIMKELKPDSLRFAIPFAHYAQNFRRVEKYKHDIEDKYDPIYYDRIKPYLSSNLLDIPYIFYMSPAFQDVNLFDFTQCIYGYYQICWGADGYVYRCTTISTPTFKQLRLGILTNDLEAFEGMILRNQDSEFNAQKCFSCGARCNRMGLEINRQWKELSK